MADIRVLPPTILGNGDLSVSFETNLVNIQNALVDYDLNSALPLQASGALIGAGSSPGYSLFQSNCPGPHLPTEFECAVDGTDPANGQAVMLRSPRQTTATGNNRVDKDDRLTLTPSAASAKLNDVVRLDVLYLNKNGAPDKNIPIHFALGFSAANGVFSATRVLTDAQGKCSVNFTVRSLRVSGVSQGPMLLVVQAGSAPFLSIGSIILGSPQPPFDLAVVRLVP